MGLANLIFVIFFLKNILSGELSTTISISLVVSFIVIILYIFGFLSIYKSINIGEALQELGDNLMILSNLIFVIGFLNFFNNLNIYLDIGFILGSLLLYLIGFYLVDKGLILNEE